jgi:hypothetical protein
MKKSFFYSPEILATKKIFSTISILWVFVLISALSSCSKNQINDLSQSNTNSGAIQYQTSTIIHTSTQTPTMGIISTPTSIPTKTMDPILNLYITVAITQGPITISTISPDSDGYIYKNAKATVYLGNDIDEIAYLNLDDLTDNGMNNSDVEIEMGSGSGGLNYSLLPINDAYFYYPDKSTLDYDSCAKYFPVTGFTEVGYDSQGLNFINGKPYCVLTNDGRIAIVSFVKNSVKFNADYSQTLSVDVTVYNKRK